MVPSPSEPHSEKVHPNSPPQVNLQHKPKVWPKILAQHSQRVIHPLNQQTINFLVSNTAIPPTEFSFFSQNYNIYTKSDMIFGISMKFWTILKKSIKIWPF